MKPIRAWLLALTSAIAMSSACHSDESGNNTPSGAGTSAAAGPKAGVAAAGSSGGTSVGLAAGSGAPSAGTLGFPAPVATTVPCGNATCQLAIPLIASFTGAMPYCVDSAQGLCGTSAMGGTCQGPTPPDPRCPAVNFMGFFSAVGCCTPDGQCGIDASQFGMGCLSLANVSAFGAFGGGFGVQFPAPRACDAPDAADAGT